MTTPRQGFVKRGIGVAKAGDAAPVAERFSDSLAKHNTDVFDRVVGIHRGVAVAAHLDTELCRGGRAPPACGRETARPISRSLGHRRDRGSPRFGSRGSTWQCAPAADRPALRSQSCGWLLETPESPRARQRRSRCPPVCQSKREGSPRCRTLDFRNGGRRRRGWPTPGQQVPHPAPEAERAESLWPRSVAPPLGSATVDRRASPDRRRCGRRWHCCSPQSARAAMAAALAAALTLQNPGMTRIRYGISDSGKMP